MPTVSADVIRPQVDRAIRRLSSPLTRREIKNGWTEDKHIELLNYLVKDLSPRVGAHSVLDISFYSAFIKWFDSAGAEVGPSDDRKMNSVLDIDLAVMEQLENQ